MVVVHVVVDLMVGGVGSVVKSLLLEQSKSGVKTALVVKSSILETEIWLKANNIDCVVFEVENYRKKHLTIWGLLSKAAKKKIDNKFKGECIVFHYHNPISIGLFSNIYKNSICTLHGNIVTNSIISKYIFVKTLKRYMRKKCKVIACSNTTALFYQNEIKIPVVDYVLNGVYNYNVKSITPFSSNKKHIGFIGCIDELKGWRYLVEAYISLPLEIQENVDLNFFGSVSEEDKLDFDNYLKTNTNIKYFGVVEEANYNVIPFLDFLVLPSRTEGLPMVILEAMQSSVICLVTNVGGVAEVIKNNYNGVIIKRDSECIRQQLIRLLTDVNLCEGLKIKAQETINIKFNSVNMANSYMIYYKKFCENNGN